VLLDTFYLADHHHDMSTRRITAGARDLRAYLTRNAVSVPTFCERHRLDRIQVQRVLNGERWQRITVDFANAIERATAGEVKWCRFLSATAKPNSDLKRAS
jgi:hypothetical protein